MGTPKMKQQAQQTSKLTLLYHAATFFIDDPLFADCLETALRVSQSRAGLWGKLGNLLCLLPLLPRDVTVLCARGGISAATHSSVSHHGPWFVLCSVGASRRCYLGMSNSHLLLSWTGSGCCDTTPDIGQTQLHLSLLRRESPAAVLPSPLVLLDNDPRIADCLETALRVSQSRAGFWGKLGNLLCLLPPLSRDVTVLCARGGIDRKSVV